MLIFLLPLVVGLTVVAQATLNRSMADTYGISTVMAFNAVVFFIFSVGFFLLALYNPMLVPKFVQATPFTAPFLIHYIIPGFCGFLLVLGMPGPLNMSERQPAFFCSLPLKSSLVFDLKFFNREKSQLLENLQAPC